MSNPEALDSGRSRYLPGAWKLICGPHVWLLAEIATDDELVDELWASIDGCAGIAPVLATLATAGIRRVPAFALIHLEPGAEKIVVRGSATVRLGSSTGEPIHLSCPPGITTWLEHPVGDNVTSVRLSGQTESEATWLPLRHGVVFASAAELGTDDEAARLPLPAEHADDPAELDTEPKSGDTGSDTLLVIPPEQEQPDDGYFESPLLPTVEVPARGRAPAGPDSVEPEDSEPDQVEPGPDRPDPYGTLAGPIEDLIRPGIEETSPDEADRSDRSLIASVPGIASPTPPPPYRYEAPEPASTPVSPVQADVDERTRSRAELAELAAAANRPVGPTVHAVRCPAGHLNPPHRGSCRICGTEIGAATPVTVPRPVLGRLRLSTGDSVTLDRGALFGRNPQETGAGGSDRPHIVRLPSPAHDISRTHLEVRLDGWHVLVTDLHSTNGTIVTLPGESPQRLRPGEAMQIQPGTEVDLAGEVSFVYEVEA